MGDKNFDLILNDSEIKAGNYTLFKVLRGSSRVSAPGTRDEPLTTSAWEAKLPANLADI